MKWESTEAPFTVTVDDPDAYSGHMDDRPLKVTVAADDDRVTINENAAPGDTDVVQVAVAPGEAYHFVDDLQAAADSCWGAAEYVVTAHFNAGQRYVGTIKAPSEAEAVRRTVDLLEMKEAEDELTGEEFIRLTAAREADRYTVYRADSGSLVTPDELTDDDSDN